MVYQYQTHGTCSRIINIDVDGGIIRKVEFKGGCDGNLQGIAKLVEGMKITDVATRLEGILCGTKSTSCPDQLSKALRQIAEIENSKSETQVI